MIKKNIDLNSLLKKSLQNAQKEHGYETPVLSVRPIYTLTEKIEHPKYAGDLGIREFDFFRDVPEIKLRGGSKDTVSDAAANVEEIVAKVRGGAKTPKEIIVKFNELLGIQTYEGSGELRTFVNTVGGEDSPDSTKVFSAVLMYRALRDLINESSAQSAGNMWEQFFARLISGKAYTPQSNVEIADVIDEGNKPYSLKLLTAGPNAHVVGSKSLLAIAVAKYGQIEYIVGEKQALKDSFYLNFYSFNINRQNFFPFVIGKINPSEKQINQEIEALSNLPILGINTLKESKAKVGSGTATRNVYNYMQKNERYLADLNTVLDELKETILAISDSSSDITYPEFVTIYSALYGYTGYKSKHGTISRNAKTFTFLGQESLKSIADALEKQIKSGKVDLPAIDQKAKNAALLQGSNISIAEMKRVLSGGLTDQRNPLRTAKSIEQFTDASIRRELDNTTAVIDAKIKKVLLDRLKNSKVDPEYVDFVTNLENDLKNHTFITYDMIASKDARKIYDKILKVKKVNASARTQYDEKETARKLSAPNTVIAIAKPDVLQKIDAFFDKIANNYGKLSESLLMEEDDEEELVPVEDDGGEEDIDVGDISDFIDKDATAADTSADMEKSSIGADFKSTKAFIFSLGKELNVDREWPAVVLNSKYVFKNAQQSNTLLEKYVQNVFAQFYYLGQGLTQYFAKDQAKGLVVAQNASINLLDELTKDHFIQGTEEGGEKLIAKQVSQLKEGLQSRSLDDIIDSLFK